MEFDFSSNQEVDEEGFAAVPADFQSAYTKREDGKYVVADTHKGLVSTIVGLSGALKSERTSSKALKAQKDAVVVIKDTFGFDTIEEAKAKFDELNAAVASNAKVDPAKIKADIQKTFDAESAVKDARNDKMKSVLSKFMVENVAISALAENKGNAKLLLPLIRDRVKLVEDGEDYVVRVLDEAGDYRGDGKGGFMTVAQMVEEMKASKDYGVAFESDGQGGSGPAQQRPNPSLRTPIGKQNPDDMSAADKLAAGLAARRNRR